MGNANLHQPRHTSQPPSKPFKMSSGKVKAVQLWDKSKDDLTKQLGELKTELGQLRMFYKNKKYAPLDLRPKQTRAIRRRLSPEDKARVLEKTKKRQTHFPQRKFAVKAA